MFKIHALCLVKNEDDIIQYTLKRASEWADSIYVFDNGSEDNTWRIVHQLSKTCNQIVPYRQSHETFYDGLRSQIFNHYKQEWNYGDWLCILDSDEIYIDNPRFFLSKIPIIYGAVWADIFQYYFTDIDFNLLSSNEGNYSDAIPIEDRIKYYKHNWRELRFFRYTKGLAWNNHSAIPSNLGFVYPVYIWMKHFQYRSPTQIQKRINLRFLAHKKSPTSYRHSTFIHEVDKDWKSSILNDCTCSDKAHYSIRKNDVPDWKERIMPASALSHDNRDGRYVVSQANIRTPPSHLKVIAKQVLFKIKLIIDSLIKF